MPFDYEVAHVVQVGEVVSIPVFKQETKSGTFSIVIEGKQVGEVDICHLHDSSYVSVQLVDTFLTIEQMIDFMNHLKEEFGLTEDQKISIQQL